MSDPKLTNSAPESAQTDKTAETVAHPSVSFRPKNETGCAPQW